MDYSVGFVGRAFLMETDQMVPTFKAALSVEAAAIDEKYSCSIEVFIGDRLKLLRTGNLVLFDALNRIKWQSFSFPTDVMLWGQRHSVATRLTSFTNSSLFFSFEIQPDKIVLYLNSGTWKYSYWEFSPSKNRNITFIQLGSKGLELFGEKHRKIAQIPSQRIEPLRFLALGNKTGNLGLYYYSPNKGKFEASFQALNSTCDLPLACKPYGVCTFSNACSCIRVFAAKNERSSDCGEGISEGLCGRSKAEMIELEGVSSVLRDEPKMTNVSKEVCANLCIDDCKCVAALHSSGKSGTNLQECFHYGLVRGVKLVDKGSGLSYLIKVPKGSGGGHGTATSVKKWVLVLVGVVDGLILLLVLGGILYYVIQKRRKNLLGTDNNN
ncbi:hypothetical protein L1049_007645 [Liquidambar formosana]|uniref:Apple domain-containing protein n=1 Tax=Liquidambar formosana TaxID=63359 RepID=A0AAP0S8G8_LIQFO